MVSSAAQEAGSRTAKVKAQLTFIVLAITLLHVVHVRTWQNSRDAERVRVNAPSGLFVVTRLSG